MLHQLHPNNWIKNYSDYLFNHALFKISNVEQAEDLVQETFLSAYKNKDTFKGEANEKTWLTSILKNKIIDFYRKRAIMNKAFQSNESDNINFFFDESEHGHWQQDNAPKDYRMNGQDKLEQKELQNALLKCFGLLPEQWNQICQLKLIDHEQTEMVCNTFNISTSNLWVILHRAKLQLRDCLQKKWLNE